MGLGLNTLTLQFVRKNSRNLKICFSVLTLTLTYPDDLKIKCVFFSVHPVTFYLEDHSESILSFFGNFLNNSVNEIILILYLWYICKAVRIR